MHKFVRKWTRSEQVELCNLVKQFDAAGKTCIELADNYGVESGQMVKWIGQMRRRIQKRADYRFGEGTIEAEQFVDAICPDLPADHGKRKETPEDLDYFDSMGDEALAADDETADDDN